LGVRERSVNQTKGLIARGRRRLAERGNRCQQEDPRASDLQQPTPEPARRAYARKPAR